MGARIERLDVSVYTIPTDGPEADGTIEWDSTTMVLVEAFAGGHCGLGYTYAHEAAAHLIERKLASVVTGRDPMDIPGAWLSMVREVRNLGRPGVAAMAISAIDTALWDLKAKLLDCSLVKLLGAVRDDIPVYGSGGFTSYSLDRLQEQLGGWVSEGIGMVKMKVGAHPDEDLRRVKAARKVIGDALLFVDANGAYSRKQALEMAERFAQQGVRWFEEPVSSDDLEGLRLLRDRAPAGMDISAGEYGYDATYFFRMIQAEAVDVVQADATRCAGITGFLKTGALCEAAHIPLSSHTAPTLHAHVCCALVQAIHAEYFYDHARIERMLFDGALAPEQGRLRPDPGRPGLGIEFKRQDAERFTV